MSEVEIYTTARCPFCMRAKQLLQDKGVSYTEYPIEGDRLLMRQLIKRCREKSVPQILINDQHIGGYEELAALDKAGTLDQLLERN